MEDFSILGYLIVFAVSIIGAWLRNSKNKKREAQEKAERQSQSRPQEENMPPVSFDLEEILRRQQEKQKAEMARQRQLEQEAAKAREAAQMAELRRERLAESRKKRHTRTELEETLTENSSILDDFDARKAIIYSEILNPPYV